MSVLRLWIAVSKRGRMQGCCAPGRVSQNGRERRSCDGHSMRAIPEARSAAAGEAGAHSCLACGSRRTNGVRQAPAGAPWLSVYSSETRSDVPWNSNSRPGLGCRDTVLMSVGSLSCIVVLSAAVGAAVAAVLPRR